MKLLLYCTKAKPYLYDHLGIRRSWDKRFNTEKIKQIGLDELLLNGKIVAECDFEVEEIEYEEMFVDIFDENEEIVGTDIDKEYYTKALYSIDLQDKSCLSFGELDNYLKGKNGYAIYIKDLHIFDKPRELSEYYTKKKNNVEETEDLFMDGILYTPIKSAPQNMMYAKQPLRNDKIIVSIKPQWLCKILNGEKIIEVRRNVLKEMLE